MRLSPIFQTSVLWAMLLSIIVSTTFIRRCSCCGCCQKHQLDQGNQKTQPSQNTPSTSQPEKSQEPRKQSSGCPHCRDQRKDPPEADPSHRSSEPQVPSSQPDTPPSSIQSCCSCENEATGVTKTCPHGSLSQPDCQCEVTEQSGLLGVSSQVCEFARWLDVQWCSCLLSPERVELFLASHSLLTSQFSPEICSRGISAQILFSCWLI